MTRVDRLQSDWATMQARLDKLTESKRSACIEALHELNPSLPRDASAFHLAHNWHVCKLHPSDTDRRVRFELERLHDRIAQVSKLKGKLWDVVYNRHFPR